MNPYDTTLVAAEGGSYDAPLLEPGQYSIEFSKEGFKKFVRQGITLHVEVIAVDAVLKVGSINESITVTADVPLVQTETSERSAVFVEKTVNDLPNVGRNWFDILGQLPGVNPGGDQDASGQSVGVNGAAPWQENFLTDGGVNTLPVSQNPGTQTPLDDIWKWRGCLQRDHQEWNQPVPWLPLRVLAERRTRGAQLLRAIYDAAPLEYVWRHNRWSNSPQQGFLLL